MTIYAIGDVQGCFDPLRRLLDKINFDPASDTLWFAGDIINRGPSSLATIRFIKSLGEKQKTVLGNHDLSCLAAAYQAKPIKPQDTFAEILTADDHEDLLQWLAACPLMLVDESLKCVLTHAGIAPIWSIAKAKQLASEVEEVLRSARIKEFLQHMYGDKPDYWEDTLTGFARLRLIVNYFTRMRYCYADGRLNLSYKGAIAEKPQDLQPWFNLLKPDQLQYQLIFGHWAALMGKTDRDDIHALDTGCVWGECLTAMDLQTKERFKVACQK